MMQNSRVTAFTVFELLRENQLGAGGGIEKQKMFQKGTKVVLDICYNHY